MTSNARSSSSREYPLVGRSEGVVGSPFETVASPEGDGWLVLLRITYSFSTRDPGLLNGLGQIGNL
jgi:hypothetical protein